jgi:hypothetical protein
MRHGETSDGRNHDVLVQSLLRADPGPWRGDG